MFWNLFILGGTGATGMGCWASGVGQDVARLMVIWAEGLPGWGTAGPGAIQSRVQLGSMGLVSIQTRVQLGSIRPPSAGPVSIHTGLVSTWTSVQPLPPLSSPAQPVPLLTAEWTRPTVSPKMTPKTVTPTPPVTHPKPQGHRCPLEARAALDLLEEGIAGAVGVAELAVAAQGEVRLDVAGADSAGQELVPHQGQGVGVRQGGREVIDDANAEASGVVALVWAPTQCHPRPSYRYPSEPTTKLRGHDGDSGGTVVGAMGGQGWGQWWGQ